MSDRYKESMRRSLLWQAEQMLWLPYVWGGDDPSGFDCSGMVLECLKGVGLVAQGIDMTADGIYKLFRHHLRADPIRGGCLLFWNSGADRMVHVAIARDLDFCITADGGGNHVKTIEDARRYNAFIKLRPILHRGRSPLAIDLFV